MSIDNNSFEILPTLQSTRKRKRNETKSSDSELCSPGRSKDKPNGGLLNLAFSSTPKKSINYEKEINYQAMEIKSIVELFNIRNGNSSKTAETSENPYEVLRKPPKKKKKSECNNEEAKCFVNSALNLDAPDKKFNPFEVKRLSPIKDPNESNLNCFINPALNIKAKDSGLNPYEVARSNSILNHANSGLENLAMEFPIPLTIGLPFKPTLGVRIDFQNMPLENLTPTKLLAEKLVFSPVNPRIAELKNLKNNNFQKSLSIISEELDIGKELDCYQIELENSINEAKLRKTETTVQNTRNSELNDITEHSEENSLPIILTTDEQKTPVVDDYKTKNEPNNEELINQNKTTTEITINAQEKITDGNIETSETIEIKVQTNTKEILNDSKEQISDDDGDSKNSFDDIDFKTPAPFVRAYRKPQIHNDFINELNGKEKPFKNTLGSVIRKSVRKLIPKDNKNSSLEKNINNKESYGQKIFESIRQSLRRNPSDKETQVPNIIKHEISIIDCAERKLYKCDENKIIGNDGFNNLRKRSLRNSLRQSKNHLLKSMFKKDTEEYNLRD